MDEIYPIHKETMERAARLPRHFFVSDGEIDIGSRVPIHCKETGETTIGVVMRKATKAEFAEFFTATTLLPYQEADGWEYFYEVKFD